MSIKIDPARLKMLRPIDDDFMRELFRDNIPLVQFVLRIITGKDDLIVLSEETQYDLKLLGARSICLDVFATDSNGRQFNLEIQRSDDGASPKRARYHSSAIDVNFLKTGQDFDMLPVTYVILITENDLFRQGKPIYVFERKDETGMSLGDDEYIIYVNGAYNNPDDSSDLARLIHDFTCYNTEDMNFELIAERAKYYKETEKGESSMCKIVEDIVKEEVTKAVAETAKTSKMQEKEQIATNLLALGTNSIEDIAKVTGLSIETIKSLAAQPQPAEV